MYILDLENRLDEKTKLLISKMEKEIKSKDKEIDDLKKKLYSYRLNICKSYWIKCENKLKRFMWVYRSGGIENHIILYDYQKTRSGSYAEGFLEGFSGYLQTDGYNKVNNIKRLYCMAHIQRKFFEIISTLSLESLKQSNELEGVNYCEQFYEIEKELREHYISLEKCMHWYESIPDELRIKTTK